MQTKTPTKTLVPTDAHYRGGSQYEITREDEQAYYGKPLANPACPELMLPKFAWKEAE